MMCSKMYPTVATCAYQMSSVHVLPVLIKRRGGATWGQ